MIMSSSQSFSLNTWEELRVEANGDTTVLKLTKGEAEVFGTEMVVGKAYKMQRSKFAVFTWRTAEIEVQGSAQCYVAQETPMKVYLNLHASFHKARQDCQTSKKTGPKILLAGGTDTGKSSLARMLVNWSVRMGFTPIYVDLDIGQGDLSPPGCMSTSFGGEGLFFINWVIEQPIDIEEGIVPQSLLTYYFGHATPSNNYKLYHRIMAQMAMKVDDRLSRDSQCQAAGSVMNTMGWVTDQGFDILTQTITAFLPDAVLVLGDEKLFFRLKKHFPKEQLAFDLIKLPKSGGVVSRESSWRKTSRDKRIHEYFYGTHTSLMPASKVVPLNSMRFVTIGSTEELPSSLLPMGSESVISQTDAHEVPLAELSRLTNSILGVSFAQKIEDVASTPVAGFYCVSEVNMKTGKITLLAPSQAPPPFQHFEDPDARPFVIIGTVRWLQR